MNTESTAVKMERWKIAVAIIFGLLTLWVIGYCVYSIYQSKQTNVKHEVFQQKLKRESDGTWGVVPLDACNVYEDAGLLALGYKLVDVEKNTYGCSSIKAQIPSEKGVISLQYSAKGYAEKATKFKLVMTMAGDLTPEEVLAARKSWAVYSAVLFTNLFGSMVGEFTESEMQELVDITEKSNINYYKDDKLLVSANVRKEGEDQIFTFNIDGLPNLNFR